MIAKEIETRLEDKLPEFTDKFIESVSIVSIIPAGTVATATTATDHFLNVGNSTIVVGALAPVGIDSITRVDDIATVVTTTNHDVTEGWFDTIEISGSNESEFNGTFALLAVPNRRTYTFSIADSGPTTATGSPKLDSPLSPFGFNGRVIVTGVPDSTTFTYDLPLPISANAVGTMIAVNGARVYSAISLDRARSVFESSNISDDKMTAFVVLGDVNASRDRKTNNDGVSSASHSGDNRQQLIQSMDIVVFRKVTKETSAGAARDLIESEIVPAIIATVVGFIPDTGFSTQTQEAIHFVSHGVGDYDTAIYAHLFSFELLATIENEDLDIEPFNVAFRDINFGMTTDIGEQPLTVGINLDDEPLEV